VSLLSSEEVEAITESRNLLKIFKGIADTEGADTSRGEYISHKIDVVDAQLKDLVERKGPHGGATL
jgi:hypothetical protein